MSGERTSVGLGYVAFRESLKHVRKIWALRLAMWSGTER